LEPDTSPTEQKSQEIYIWQVIVLLRIVDHFDLISWAVAVYVPFKEGRIDMGEGKPFLSQTRQSLVGPLAQKPRREIVTMLKADLL
jgi:hypothetical protein